MAEEYRGQPANRPGTSFTTPYERLNASPQANAPGGPSFYTPTQAWWRDRSKQTTRPTPGRRGLYPADPKPAMPLYRRTVAPNGDTEVSMMSADSDGWLDMGGPPITNPAPVVS